MNRIYSDERDFVLLTGACGFVGRYLLRDLLLSGHHVAVAVRSRGRHNALSRVEKVLAFCEDTAGRSLPMPRVIDWDLRDHASKGISQDDHDWLAGNVRSILHSAAIVRFTLDGKAKEPFESNVGGTQRLTELAAALGRVDFHHVSTAYVCGDCTGPAFEDETRIPSFKNVYEESKFLAEAQLREAARAFNSLTIYRPSIVIGDSKTGYASAFQTIYSGLRLASTMPESYRNDVESLFKWLGISGQATKNLVPVDWVSSVVVAIFEQPTLHNKTYHLTNPEDVSVEKLAAAMVGAFQKEPHIWQSMKSLATETIFIDDVKRVFLDSFQNYFCNDPVFNRSNIESALPNLVVPELTLERLERMFRFAIRQRFMEADNALPTTVKAIANSSRATAPSVSMPVFPVAWSLTIFDDPGFDDPGFDGPGFDGPGFSVSHDHSMRKTHYLFQESGPSSDHRANTEVPQVFVRRTALHLLKSGELSFEHAMRAGHLVVVGTSDLLEIAILQFRECIASPFGLTLFADNVPSNPSLDFNSSLCGQVGER